MDNFQLLEVNSIEDNFYFMCVRILLVQKSKCFERQFYSLLFDYANDFFPQVLNREIFSS